MPECNTRILIFKETKVASERCRCWGDVENGLPLLDGNIFAFEKF